MGAVTSCMSNIMYLSEKIILYSTCVGLVSTVVLMFVVTLGMGIGLGYNYCFVDMKTKYKYVPGHYVYPDSLRFPYYRRSGEQQPDQTVLTKGEIEEAENDALRYPNPPSRPQELQFSLRDRESNITNLINGTEEYYTANEDDYSNNTVVERGDMDVETQFDNNTVATDGTESTETVVIVDTTETEETTEIIETTVITDTTETTESSEIKTDDVYSIDEPTPEPVFPDEKRRVKKLVIPISGLDLVSLLSKLSAEKNNHSLQIVTT